VDTIVWRTLCALLIDSTEPFQRLIEKQALLAYKYTGFCQCMDTFKDQRRLEALNQGTAPWKVWNHGSAAVMEHSKAIMAGA
jgi:glucose-1-phosphate cytidylyltransferase